MEWFEAVLLGLIQGLTEFLPVSSSGHLEIGKELLGVETTDDLLFTTMVHAATVLSTIIVFRKQIWDLLKGFFGGLKGDIHIQLSILDILSLILEVSVGERVKGEVSKMGI